MVRQIQMMRPYIPTDGPIHEKFIAEMLKLKNQGKTAPQIADAFGISVERARNAIRSAKT